MKSRNIAFGAVYAAFSTLLLIISLSLSDDPFTLMLSSLPVMFILDSFDFKTAFTVYLTVLFLAFSLFGLRISVVGFALLFGPYALIRKFVSKRTVSFFFLRWIILASLAFGTYSVVNSVLKINEDYFKIATILLLLASLFMYDRLAEYAILWHRRFFKRFSDKGR